MILFLSAGLFTADIAIIEIIFRFRNTLVRTTSIGRIRHTPFYKLAQSAFCPGIDNVRVYSMIWGPTARRKVHK